ncbi:MAG: enoyl-CoA hydratase/isomerase family protein [Deltaproteobacteria bacterium]|nr:enoyl-CoA hydratase/isomerase family protein [Deltaproteobacteria bacterium]
MSLVLLEEKNSIATLTFNHPDKLNAMTEAMGEAMQSRVEEIKQKPNLRVIIIQGAGRAFSAGGDLQFLLDHQKNTPEENTQKMLAFYSKFLALREIPVPTLAKIHGHAIGAGLLVSLACDLRYASQESKLAVNFAKLGLSSGMGGLYTLSRLAGMARAAELAFTGKTILASEAQEIGLINQVYPAEKLDQEVQKIAESIAANGPIALKIIKKGLQMAPEASLEKILNYEAQGQAQCYASEDLKEGIEAIRAKRSPNFKNR